MLAVLFQHVFEVIVQKHPTGAYYWVFHDAIGYYMNFGRFGVVLFFFVSGFVIPFSFPDSATPVRDFTISRFFRLYPAYWTSMVIGLVTMQVLEANAYPLSQVIANVTMLQTFVNIPNLWIFYWTLAIELLFYVGCTILFAMGLLNRRFTAVAIVIAAALVGTAAALLIESRTVSSLMEVGLNLSAMFLGKVIRDTVIGGSCDGRTSPFVRCSMRSSPSRWRRGGSAASIRRTSSTAIRSGRLMSAQRSSSSRLRRSVRGWPGARWRSWEPSAIPSI